MIRFSTLLKPFVALIFISNFVNAQTTTWNTVGNTTNNNSILGTLNNQPIIFYTNGIETMRLKPNGDLRINTLSGTGNNFVFSTSSGVLYSKPFSNDTDKFLTEAGNFRTASSFTGWKMIGNTIHSINGTYVGIGNNNPQFILDVNGDVHFNGIVNAIGINIVNKLQADTIKGATLVKVNNTMFLTGGAQNSIYTTTGDLRLQSNSIYTGNTLLNTSNGNVGIGIFSPQFKLDVNGDVQVSGKIHVFRIVPLLGDSEIHIGDSSLVLGLTRIYNNSGTHGVGLGDATFATGQYSVAIGRRVTSGPAATNAVTIGCGVTNGPVLFNNIPYSFAVGFNSTIPTFFVGQASGVGTIGKVGIGTQNPQGDFQVGDGTAVKFCVRTDGRVVVGAQTILPTSPFNADPSTILTVDGRIMCKDIVVSTTADWPDYVFDSTYVLMPLDSVAQFVNGNKHLPASTPASTMQQNGISVSQTATTQQQQIEEMMLYILQLNERMKVLEAENAKLKTQGNK